MKEASSTPARVRLPRMKRRDVLARNQIAQRVSALSVPWEGSAWQLTLRPSLKKGPLPVGESEWCLRLSWDGVPLDLVLPAAGAQAWLHTRFPDLDLPELPEPFLAALMARACGSLTGALGDLQCGAVRVDGLVRGPSEGRPLEHVFNLEAVSGESAVRGRLAVDPLGLELMAGEAAKLEVATNRMQLDDLPILMRLEVGALWLDASQLSSLVPGDAILMEQSLPGEDRKLWLACGDSGLQVVVEETRMTVLTAFRSGGWVMPPHESRSDADSTLATIDHLPLRVVFDLGEMSMTLSQLRDLQVGQSIELGYPLPSVVRVRVNGALVGTGELVDIDGRLGVTLTALAPRAQAQPPYAEQLLASAPGGSARVEMQDELR